MAKKTKQICPVCGTKLKLTLHHILPKYIFKEIKTDDRAFFLTGENSYRICRKCHDNYEKRANNLKKKLLKDLDFPEVSLMPFVLDMEKRKVRNLCRFMAGKFTTNNYNYSIYEAYNYVKKLYNKQYLSYDEILHWSNINDVIPNEKYIGIGRFLIEKLGVEELDRLFRNDLRIFLQKRNATQVEAILEKNKYYEV